MAFPLSELNHLTDLACQAADAAARETLPLFRTAGLVADNKLAGAFDPVTAADKAAEAAIRKVVLAARPDDSIVGEEDANIDGSSGVVWVIDPIDGTRGFISGTPTWGTLIAVGDAQGPRIGIVDQPYIGERFIGTPNGAVLRRGGADQPISVRDVRNFEDATIFTTFPEVGRDQDRAGFVRVADECKMVRYGMDCYAYALLAAGQIDLVIEAGLAPYDVQGPIALVQAAGGVATNWSGGSAAQGGQIICAATPQLHAKALKLLEPYADG